jgi:predicted N-acetyltransferase YhbS
VEIRTAAADEYETIADITVNAYVDEARRNGNAESVGGDSHFNSTYVPELRNVAGRARDAVVLVAADDDSILGAVTYVPGLGPYAEFDDPDAAGIRMLAVTPAAQGRGVGAALVQACLDRARSEGRGQDLGNVTGRSWKRLNHSG